MDESLTAPNRLITAFSDLSDSNKIVWEQTHLLLALSGGLDSVCMLHLLNACKDLLGFSMRAIHFNHGLRGVESDSDMNFCLNLCSHLGVEIDLINFQMNKTSSNLQGIARERRHQYYSNWRRRGQFYLVATAHHKDDFLESFLIGVHQGRLDERLIPLQIIDLGSQFLRPLVLFNKMELRGLAIKSNWDWREDSSNSNTNYLRNFYRKELLMNSDLAQSVSNLTHRLQNLDLDLKDWLAIQIKKFDERGSSLDRNECMHWELPRFRDFWLAILQRDYPAFLKNFDAKRLSQIRVQKYKGNRRFQIGCNHSIFMKKLILVETRQAYHLELE